MRTNFLTALASVLAHEGGYVNDPLDPGGATNKGVTQGVYDTYRASKGMTLRSVKLLETMETADIYRRQYWNAIRGDELPSGLDYCTFDYAVNSGVNRAARYLQRLVGVAEDGQIGPVTIAAVKAHNSATLIAQLCCAREMFLAKQPTFAHFGRGWLRRVAEVRLHAGELA